MRSIIGISHFLFRSKIILDSLILLKAFFIQMTSYQKLYNAREDVIYDLEIERRVGSNKSGKCIFVELKNEAGMLLASFYWWIGFQPEQSGFFESYKVLFTDEGMFY